VRAAGHEVNVTSLADRVRALAPEVRAEIYARIDEEFGAGALADLRYDFERVWARDDQIVTVDELRRYGLIVFTGERGSGKTEAAVNLFNREIFAGRAKRPRVFAANEGDVETAVVWGQSGIMQALHPSQRPRWIGDEGPAGVLKYPNGVEAVCFSAASREGAVSHQGDLDLYDDVAKWGPSAPTAWGHARVSCRLGYACGIVATTRRGTRILKRLLNKAIAGVLIRRADLRANKYNIAAKLWPQMMAEFEGTSFLAQELGDEDIEGESPFAEVEFGELHVDALPIDVREIGIGIDPATSSATHSCEVGIVAAARDVRDVVYGARDVSSVMNAGQWPVAAWDLYDELHALFPRAKIRFVVETNKGGQMPGELLRYEEKVRNARAGKPAISSVEIVEVHAAKSKTARAGGLSPLVRAGQLRMVRGLHVLEGQLRELDDVSSTKSDRADAFVHAAHNIAHLDERKAIDARTELKAIVKANESGFVAPRWSGRVIDFGGRPDSI
jgi:phage terminase large subunit-like protein